MVNIYPWVVWKTKLKEILEAKLKQMVEAKLKQIVEAMVKNVIVDVEKSFKALHCQMCGKYVKKNRESQKTC